ncbi:MAG TPA: protein-disulfide reductase DsbD family protein [Saprospiraceae bacterium]|nr:protein-disulfide reductase DsbD family protein [Saprospiraceae bacterium]
MTRYFTVLPFLFISLLSMAQKSPVSWSFSLDKTQAQTSEFKATAQINKGWNIYAVYMSDEGPIPTSFTFDQVQNGVMDGKIKEMSKAIKGFDELFEMEVVKFKEEAVFTQAFSTTGALRVKGSVTFMCCDSERCLPPATVQFDLKQ